MGGVRNTDGSGLDPRRVPERRIPAERSRPGGFARHDVLAVFADMDAARGAVQALQMSGLDASAISLFGPAADEAAADPLVAEADARFGSVMWRRSWVGAVIGTAVGAVAGGLGAWVVLGGMGGPVTGVFWAAVVGTAVFGLGTGAATGAASAAQMSRAWELTFHSVLPGEVGVAVHTDKAATAAHSERVLARRQPRQLERLDMPDV